MGSRPYSFDAAPLKVLIQGFDPSLELRCCLLPQVRQFMVQLMDLSVDVLQPLLHDLPVFSTLLLGIGLALRE